METDRLSPTALKKSDEGAAGNFDQGFPLKEKRGQTILI